MRNVSVIIFYDDKKRVLLQNRKGIDVRGIEWGFFGGGIEKGETPEQAIVRETKEELGFALKDFIFIKNYRNESDGDLFVFISKLGNNMSKFRQMEGKSMQLFTPEEAENIKLSKRDIAVIRELKNIL
jgi:8-oxo-dGTP diphosphatase